MFLEPLTREAVKIADVRTKLSRPPPHEAVRVMDAKKEDMEGLFLLGEAFCRRASGWTGSSRGPCGGLTGSLHGPCAARGAGARSTA